jgi:hypothetical protein
MRWCRNIRAPPAQQLDTLDVVQADRLDLRDEGAPGATLTPPSSAGALSITSRWGVYRFRIADETDFMPIPGLLPRSERALRLHVPTVAPTF